MTREKRRAEILRRYRGCIPLHTRASRSAHRHSSACVPKVMTKVRGDEVRGEKRVRRRATRTIGQGGLNLNTYTTDPKWFAHWWAAQRHRGDHIGCYAEEVYAEAVIPLRPTPLHDIVDGLPEFFADLIEDAWFEWEDVTRQNPWGWAYVENLLNYLYPEEVERGPNHRVLPPRARLNTRWESRSVGHGDHRRAMS
jgi:hypothetical protein